MNDHQDDLLEPSTYDDVFEETQPDMVGEDPFASLTVAGLFGEFFRSPLETWQRLVDFVRLGDVRRSGVVSNEQIESAWQSEGRLSQEELVFDADEWDESITNRDLSDSHKIKQDNRNKINSNQVIQDEEILQADSEYQIEEKQIVVDRWIIGSIVLQVTAFLITLVGCYILVGGNRRFENAQLHRSIPYLVIGIIVWLVSAGLVRRSRLSFWPDNQSLNIADVIHAKPKDYSSLLIRAAIAVAALMLAVVTWTDTGLRQGQINQFRLVGFWAWILSIIFITLAFAPDHWRPRYFVDSVSDWFGRINLSRTGSALILIILIGAAFRLYNLDGVPPEMTSDHIEKILDSQRVVEGARDVFFANNGGREPFQMYAMAIISRLPGMAMNFTTLKLLAVIEGVITLPALWWMGREVIGLERRALGNVVGLILAALVAVSYWHVAITRLALRIVLTPLMVSLLVGFLSRGIRYNRRGDFIIVGLLLGFSFYTYQAMRMFPVVVVVGVFIAILFGLRQLAQVRQLLFHLGMVALISFIIFVPMFRYSMDFPDQFWMRASGRLFGDNLIIEENENGQRIPREATFDERVEAFKENLPVLTSNIRNALLMFHWKGDVAWINGLPNHPAFDPFSGALLIVGLAAWLLLIFRYRDPVHVLIPFMVLVMILPSALSIAAPMENPSATRMSGSLPPVYLITALPLALLALALWRTTSRSVPGLAMASGSVLLVLSGSLIVNSDTYFNGYRDSYVRSWTSHRVPADILRGFAETEGGYGNAFIVGYEHWLDHRIVANEAGAMKWANAIADVNDRKTGIKAVPDFLNDAWYCPGPNYPYRIDPQRSLLFFYEGQDEEAARLLAEWFPGGFSSWIDVEREGDDFYVYRTQPLGEAGFVEWLAEHTVNPRCPA